MKKEYILLAIMLAGVLMLTGCTLLGVLRHNNSEDPDEPSKESSEVSEIKVRDKNECIITLDANPTTGFNWAVVYHTDNVTVDSMEYTSDDTHGEVLDGVGGTVDVDFHVAEGDRAILILKYYRDWEPGIPASYAAYTITMANGEVEDVECKDWYCMSDSVNAFTFFDDHYFFVCLPSDYEYSEYPENPNFAENSENSGEDGNECGIRFYPKGETDAARIYHADEYNVRELADTERTFQMGSAEFKMGLDADGRMVYLYSPARDLCLVTDGASWAEERLADLIEIMDAAYWEE